MAKTGFAEAKLRSFIERIERLNEEKSALTADISEVFNEAKGQGFCVKTMREIIKLRAMEDHERQEREAMLDLYKSALGMLNGTPLGDASLRKAVRDLGTPVPLTDEEKARGDVAAFERKGTRMSVGVGG